MPRGDRTGPQGLGPMTGRRAGYCAGYDAPGFETMNAGYGRGFGRGYGHGFHGGGRGFGRGYGYGWGRAYAAPDRETERRIVENRISDLKEQLKALEDRLSAFDNDKRKEE